MFKAIFIFLNSIENEWASDKEMDFRIFGHDRMYVFRPLKVRARLESLRFKGFFYVFGSVVFLMILPFFFLFQFFKVIFFKVVRCEPNRRSIMNEDLVLDFNGRTSHLIKRFGSVKGNARTINNRMNLGSGSALQFANFLDCFRALILAFLAYSFVLVKARSFGYALHAVFSFHWFLVYLSLRRVRFFSEQTRVYFSNHYDRWCCLIDEVFAGQDLCLIQHGILPDNFIIPFPPKNIKKIFCFDEPSKIAFDRVFGGIDGASISFFSPKLHLQDIHLSAFSVLVIGQPHSAKKEIELVSKIRFSSSDINIFLKPHPVFGAGIYAKVKDVLIRDKFFFPKVNLVVCEDSTLGFEYETLGVPVIWWGHRSVDNMLSSIIEFKSKHGQ